MATEERKPWRVAVKIPVRLPTVNEMLRMHWRKRITVRKALGWALHVCIPPARRPPAPLTKVTIRIERHGAGTPDPDGLRTCAKHVLDVLQPFSRKHPNGLGIIADDTSAVVGDPEVVSVKAPRTVAFFTLEITEVLP